MNRCDWRNYWERQAEQCASDFEFDRGICPRTNEIETSSNRELVDFIAPKLSEVVFDAGCGSGVNILLLHSKVKQMIGMDYSEGAVARCERRVLSNNIKNVALVRGDVTSPSLPDGSVDKVLCMSVFQYLDDTQVRATLKQFRRILCDNGVLIIHVKNISSLYLSTLWLAKKIKSLVRKRTKIEYLRSFRWYVAELTSSGFEILDYNSFNLLMVESMPTRLLQFFEKLELRYYDRFPLRLAFVRRHGSELKIKARIIKAS